MQMKTIVAGFVVSALTAGAVLADGGRPSFGTLDADGNGRITRDEGSAHSSKRFSEADADGDGFLTEDELARGAQERAKTMAARILERLDTDDDGRISEAEMSARMDRSGKMFDRLDANEDGGISEEEFAAARERGGKRMKDRRNGG